MYRSALMKISATTGIGLCLLSLAIPGVVSAGTPTHVSHHRARSAGVRAPKASVTVSINLPANQPWVDTGIDLSVGTHVTITATGTMVPCVGCGTVTPAGDPGQASEAYLAPGVDLYALIGRIGNSAPRKVGAAAQFVSLASGRLGLGINDNVFSDNVGSYTSVITVQ